MYIRKNIFLYCIYWLLLLFFNLLDFMHGGYYLTQKGERVHAYCPLALSPEAEVCEDFLHSPENFNLYTLLRIPTLLKSSIKTKNYIQR